MTAQPGYVMVDFTMEFTLYMQIQMVHLPYFQTNHAGICP